MIYRESSHELVWKAVGLDKRISKSRLAAMVNMVTMVFNIPLCYQDNDGPIKSTKRIQITQEGDSLGIR